jgi:hypothetical protein
VDGAPAPLVQGLEAVYAKTEESGRTRSFVLKPFVVVCYFFIEVRQLYVIM